MGNRLLALGVARAVTNYKCLSKRQLERGQASTTLGFRFVSRDLRSIAEDLIRESLFRPYFEYIGLRAATCLRNCARVAVGLRAACLELSL
jgi:hypothetical protein